MRDVMFSFCLNHVKDWSERRSPMFQLLKKQPTLFRHGMFFFGNMHFLKRDGPFHHVESFQGVTRAQC